MKTTNQGSAPKFTNENYEEWSFRFQAHLRKNKLWGIINTTKPKHLQNMEKRIGPEKWKVLDQDLAYEDEQEEVKAYLIEAMVSSKKLNLIKRHNTPKQMWEAIKTEYEEGAAKEEALAAAQSRMLSFTLEKNNNDIHKLIDAIDDNAALQENLGTPTKLQLQILYRALENCNDEEVRRTITSLRISKADYPTASAELKRVGKRMPRATAPEINAFLTNQPMKKKGLCRFFKAGKCNKGNKCDFEHQKPKPSRKLPKEYPPSLRNICRRFQTNQCQKGSKCPYHHVTLKCNICQQQGHGSPNCPTNASMTNPAPTSSANLVQEQPIVFALTAEVQEEDIADKNIVFSNLIRFIADTGAQKTLAKNLTL